MYEPWTTNIMTALPGSTIAVKSNSPEIVQTAMIGDSLFFSDAFLTERRDVAIKLMKAYWDAVQWWRDNPAEGGARVGYVNPDQTTVDYLRGKKYAPQGEEFDRAAAWWLSMASDPEAPRHPA